MRRARYCRNGHDVPIADGVASSSTITTDGSHFGGGLSWQFVAPDSSKKIYLA